MDAIINLLRDIIAFADQFIPSHIALFHKYRFSPADLDGRGRNGRTAPLSSASSPTRAANANCSGSDNNNNDNDNILATVDVLSYNVNHAAVRIPNRARGVLHAILSSGADVVLLQETSPAWEERLLSSVDDGGAAAMAMARRYPHRRFRHPRVDDRAAGGIAILSKHPLENARVLDFSREVPGSVFPALTCEVRLPMESSRCSDEPETMGAADSTDRYVMVSISNVHLRPPVELDGSARLETARKTEPIRVSEVKEMMQRRAASFEGGGALANAARPPFDIVAGDFNEGDDAGALRYLKSWGYVDALQRYVPRGKETHAWPFARNLWTLRKRLDHVLWHEGPLSATFEEEERMVKLQCLGCGIMTGYEKNASDHQPVLSRFATVRE